MTVEAHDASTKGRAQAAREWLALQPIQALVLVTLGSLLLRVFWLDRPRNALIFDEPYYVNAARIILGRHVAAGAPYAGAHPGLDPNREHPPLGKLLIAGGMRLLGDNAYGWRLASVVAGVASIVLVYGVVRAAGGDEWLGVLAALVFSLDNLAFVHSRIATLDMPLVAFLLLGAFCWFRGWKLAAGAACGLAALVKLGGVYGLAGLVLIELGYLARGLVRERRVERSRLRSIAILCASFLAVWFGGLWLLDLAWSQYNSPWSHLHYMLKYGFGLKHSGGPANVESNPWQWLANEVQMPYLRVDENISVNGHVVLARPLVWFRGAMNPVLIGAVPLGVAYAAWRAWQFADKLAVWVLAWFAATYLSFFPLALVSHRTMYIYYFLPTVPAAAIAIALLLWYALPRMVLWGYLAGLVLAFADYFPFRRIL